MRQRQRIEFWPRPYPMAPPAWAHCDDHDDAQSWGDNRRSPLTSKQDVLSISPISDGSGLIACPVGCASNASLADSSARPGLNSSGF